ncbi:MAG: hypothetical protein ABIY90_08335 [Puia sp.]
MKRFPFVTGSRVTFLLLPFLFLFARRKWKFAVFYLLMMSFLSTGCYQYFYSTSTKTTINNSTLALLKNSNKYYIVHLKVGAYALQNIRVKDSLLSADLEQVTIDHLDWMDPQPGSSPSYKKKDGSYVLSEIHIYAPTIVPEDSTHLEIPVSAITRVDVYEKNIRKTRTNHAWSTVAAIVIPLGIIVAIVAIAASSASSSSTPTTSQSCSCPQVYAFDGSQYQFKNGVFSGAIYSSLERTDYLPLENMKNVGGKLMFKLVNNREEEQYINQLALIHIPHDTATKVLLDKNGMPHTYQKTADPVSTTIMNDRAGQVFKQRDGNGFLFNEKTSKDSKFGEVILAFDKPVYARKCKLIVNAKNTLWAGYIFEEFSSLFGDQFRKYQEKQDKENKQKLERWMKEQAVPLMVYVETDAGWKLADYFPIAGNGANRDMIMELNIPDTKKSQLRIKIESAFMFWDLDYVAIDFSPDQDVQTEIIHVTTAMKSDSLTNELQSLTYRDKGYSKLLQDEFVAVEFNIPGDENQQNSYFLASTGYYHSMKQYEGKADFSQLKHFKRPGAFSEFSEYKFDQARELLAKGVELRKAPK